MCISNFQKVSTTLFLYVNNNITTDLLSLLSLLILYCARYRYSSPTGIVDKSGGVVLETTTSCDNEDVVGDDTDDHDDDDAGGVS